MNPRSRAPWCRSPSMLRRLQVGRAAPGPDPRWDGGSVATDVVPVGHTTRRYP